jgi:hypothetical protein
LVHIATVDPTRVNLAITLPEKKRRKH